MKKSLQYICWISILNLPPALFYAASFAPDFSQSSLAALFTYIAATLGLFFLFFFVPGLLFLLLPATTFKKWGKGFYLYCALIVLAVHTAIAVDAHVFELYRFHVNAAMLDLFVNGGGQIISFSSSTILSIIAELSVLIAYSLASTAGARILTDKEKTALPWCAAAVVLYLGANVTHAFSSAKARLDIVEIANRLPLYKPLTMNSLLLKIGYVTKEELTNRKVHVRGGGIFGYPKKKFDYAPPRQKLNVLWVFVDALRHDMLTEQIMPNTYAFARNGMIFENHYSASNSTRGGIFGVFYGLPPSYWHVALSAGRPAGLIQAARDNGYAVGAFVSALLTKPEFHNTVFVGEKNLRLSSDGSDVIARDNDVVNDLTEFLKKRKEDGKNFFSFAFLDNVHAAAVPKGYKGPFQPAWESVNHLKLSADLDPTEYFNLYKNAAHFADTNIGRILKTVKSLGLDENTIVMISSDHGEEFNDNKRNYWGHNGNFTDAQIKIPLVVKWPGKGVGRVEAQSTAYDLSATILPEVFGVKNPLSDYTVGQNLFDLKPRRSFVCGSYSESAIIEQDRIVLIDAYGVLRFKSKDYGEAKRTTRDSDLLNDVKLFSEFLE